jgi:phage baseplate assembly protein W
MGALRHDYAFPFQIDQGSRQAGQSTYEAHVSQMIRQVLLTSPGERADLPDFGCGLRALLFAPNSEALVASVRMMVQQALQRWLSEHITVQSVDVLPPEASPDENQIVVQIGYILLATRASQSALVLVS